ncbi:phage distal tail protein, Rcc01695 family [Roseinatronobacter sp. NSM]|uniref:phage distal tail protein, Rcc01695 family n=1 Tax=Roseinatronobacter sp. NSM TaxID=3457785 RepID=UPI004035A038
MAFHDIRFPPALSFGALGGPERRTEIVRLANGFEERNTPWSTSRRRYDAGTGLRALDDLETLIAFFEARQGMLHAFRWKDWGDYRSAPASADMTPFDQLLGHGDGQTRDFALRKGYASGAQTYWRAVNKPVAGSVLAAVGQDALLQGNDFSVDTARGIIRFQRPPENGAEIRAGFEFDVPVRFDTDMLQISVASFRAGEVPKVPVIEVRL